MTDLLFRLLLPILLAAATAWAIDFAGVRRRLQAPGFLDTAGLSAGPRRASFLFLFSIVLFLTVFQAVAMFGVEVETDLSQVPTWQLFWVHWMLVGVLSAWYLLGFGGLPQMRGRLSKEWVQQFGLATPNVGGEVLLGLGLGIVGWVAVLVLVTAIGMLVTVLGGGEALPQEVPQTIVWMASLSIPLRLMIAVSAGVVEEVFFRGFLQPRIGIWPSSALFVLAHMSYGQPFLLIGISLLSVGFAFLARWRGNVWASITAHFVFDAVQLLVLIPAALRVMT